MKRVRFDSNGLQDTAIIFYVQCFQPQASLAIMGEPILERSCGLIPAKGVNEPVATKRLGFEGTIR